MKITLLINLVKATEKIIESELDLEGFSKQEIQKMLEQLIFTVAEMGIEEPAELLLKWFGDRATIIGRLQKFQERGAFDEVALEIATAKQPPVERYLNLRHIAKLAAHQAEAIETEAVAEACDRFSNNGDSHIIAREPGKGKLVLAFREESPRSSEAVELSRLELTLKQERHRLMRQNSPKLIELQSKIDALRQEIEQLTNNSETERIETDITEAQQSLAYKVAELRFYPEREEF